MKVYLAGASKELLRIQTIREVLREAGVDVTSRWIDIIESVGSEHDKHIDRAELERYAEINREDIEASKTLVYVRPEYAKSVGAGWELGFAHGCGQNVIVFDAWPERDGMSLFALLEEHHVSTMDALVAALTGLDPAV